MKKTALILVLLMTQLVSCQTILPLKTLDVPNGVYLKDLDNTFGPYIGKWEGTLNNKKYSFEFVKFTQRLVVRSNSYSYYRDDLMGKFKVTDLNSGTVIYDNTSAVNYDQYLIDGTNPNTSKGICFFYFMDTDANCQNGMEFTLMNVVGHPDQLKYCYFKLTDWWTNINCTNYPNRAAIPVFLPQQDLILTKI